ncbi:toll-like receptor 3 [Dreissena polymorpha]|uniref:toll-like receptor 3 n=1 Tax=Dreissena polymorpha TaxID=45954 RepID=UPI0022647C48|nr:toll-like receptor 3 [Dreissena polymorpha]
MSNNNLQNLTSQTKTPFANFSNLMDLNLFNTSINLRLNNTATIDSETFVGLSGIQVLNISHNVDLPLTNKTNEHVFNHLTSLKKLVSYQTTFIYHINHSYPSNLWRNLHSLQEIWIDGFTLEPFSKDFLNMSKVVDLSNNFCSVVKTDFFKGMSNVKRLYLQRNNLYSAVENKKLFHSNVHIEIIDLSVNRISRLHPLLFANQTKMRKINLAYNNLMAFDNKIEFALDILKPKLNELYYQVFTFNDIESGRSINDAVSNAIHGSKVVVFVVSKLCNNDPEWKCAVEMTEIENLK